MEYIAVDYNRRRWHGTKDKVVRINQTDVS